MISRVVLVHGSMDRSTSFAKVARRLPDLDVRRYDRRGYGRARSDGVAAALDDHVADLLAVVGSEPAAVVGHSLGGVIALMASVAHPELVPTVGAFEAPMSWLPSWPAASAGGNALGVADDPAEAAERFMRGILGDTVWERLPSRTRRARRDEGVTLVAELADLRRTAPYEPTGLTVPVVAAYGTESKPYHQEAARQLASLAPLGELVVIEGSGHAAPLTHPAEFASFVRRVAERG